MGRLPLEGIRIIDSTYVFALPYAGGLMADMGAEVQSDGTPFPRLENSRPILAGGQGRSPLDTRDSSIIIIMFLCGAGGAILGGIVGYLIR